jgi:SulP family sulfate permease
MPDGSSTAHLYRPKLLTVLSEGYDLAALRRDAAAGLTVAVVALPLSLAIAVASGVTPERGLYAAIIGGLVVSLLGGSRFQIGGPAGAFIVLVAATVARFGLDGLLLTVMLSGILLALAGALRIGSLIRHVPQAVTVGFTAAIAIVILASQLKDLGGLRLAGAEPGPLLPKLAVLGAALPSINPWALSIGLICAALIWLLRSLRPDWPGMLIAIIAASAATYLLQLPVETIGSRFGAFSGMLPAPHLPHISIARLTELLPATLSFTLLGGVESLLSARIADGMSGRQHRSNMELVAQGLANIASALFGGIAVTGTIARTATNIRAGAQSPVAGILHALFLLLFLVAAAPLAAFIPLSALAGMLLVVCWNMAEKHEFSRMLRRWRSATILLATFLLTLAFDLATGIIAGCLLSWLTAGASRLASLRPD